MKLLIVAMGLQLPWFGITPSYARHIAGPALSPALVMNAVHAAA